MSPTPPSRLLPWLLRLHVLDRFTGQTVPLGSVINYSQLKLLEQVEADLAAGRPVRIIILKARQMGISTIVEALMFTMALMMDNFRGLVVSHESDSSRHLLSMTRTYWSTFWGQELWTPSSNAQNRLGWVETNSDIHITTARNLGGGRSQTLRFLHASEVGFWDRDPETLMTGLNQSVPRSPGTFIFLESTANGIGNYFHSTWKEAERGKNMYTPLFLGWWEYPHYTAWAIGKGDEVSRPLVFLDSEERILAKFLKSKGMDASEVKARLIWRRDVIATECLGDINKFHQEYPTTPDEAFIATGKNVFDKKRLDKIHHPDVDTWTGRLIETNGRIEFQHDNLGPLKVYRRPSKNRSSGQYVVGADPSRALEGDFACAQVLNRRTWEQCAVFRDRNTEPWTFAEELIKLGRWYTEAIVACETTGGGAGTNGVLLNREYPNIYIHRKTGDIKGQMQTTYGWVTNAQTKPEVIGNLKSAVNEAAKPENLEHGYGLKLHDHETYSEMVNYVTLDGRGQFGPADNSGHDDTVMALSIALTIAFYEPLEGSGREQPRDESLPSLATQHDVDVNRAHQAAGTTLSTKTVEGDDGKFYQSPSKALGDIGFHDDPTTSMFEGEF
jgi:hypothetical protein